MQIAEIILSEVTIITIICLLMGFSMVYFLYQNNESQLLQRELFKKELLLTQLEIQEHTFQRISQELHDNIGQCLALAKLHLIYRKNKSPEYTIYHATTIIEKCIEDIRNFSKSLNTDSISSMGLVAMVKSFMEQIRKTRKYKISLAVEGERVDLQSDKELMLFRIVQEAIHNIIKHSGADSIWVSFLYRKNKELEVRIADNGIGFNIDETIKKGYLNGSSGLQNIIRRIKVLGAKYNLNSNQNKGTEICITIPI